MAGIEGNQNNFFLKKLLPPELMQQMQGAKGNGVNSLQGVGGVQKVGGVEPLGQPKEDPKAEAKKAEIARIAEDAMQELQIEEGAERDLFLNDIKKKMSS